MDGPNPGEKDFLTGFYTREHLASTLVKRIIDANVHNEKFSILLIDIDHFKKINDKYGHLWGDEFLKYVSSTLRLTLENKGLIFRYGGDEFVVLFQTRDPKEAFALAKQFNLVMRSRPFVFNGRLFKITISCGLATYPNDGHGAEDLIKVADKALYFSKKYGRNMTTRASSIALQKYKIIIFIFLELVFFGAVALFLNSRMMRNTAVATLHEVVIKRFFPVGKNADTTIVLKSGDVILGRIITEDEDKLVVSVSLGYGQCTMNIDKASIHSIKHTKNNKENNNK